MWILAKIYLFLATTLAMSAARWRLLGPAALFALIVVAILVGPLLSTDVAQDRTQYFLWYMRANAGVVYGQDIIFSLLLSALPENLTESQVFLALNMTLTAVLVFTIHRAGPRIELSASLIPLCLVVIYADRLWFDMMYNTLRSTLSIMFLLLALSARALVSRICFTFLSLGLHFYAGIVVSVIYLGSRSLVKSHRVMMALSVICVFWFLLKFVFGIDVFTVPEVKLLGFDERTIRALTQAEGEVSRSRAIQFMLAVFLPMSLVAWRYRKKRMFERLSGYARQVWAFGLAVSFFFLLVFPAYPLALRFLAIPLIAFAILSSRASLLMLAFIKSSVIFFIFL